MANPRRQWERIHMEIGQCGFVVFEPGDLRVATSTDRKAPSMCRAPCASAILGTSDCWHMFGPPLHSVPITLSLALFVCCNLENNSGISGLHSSAFLPFPRRSLCAVCRVAGDHVWSSGRPQAASRRLPTPHASTRNKPAPHLPSALFLSSAALDLFLPPCLVLF